MFFICLFGFVFSDRVQILQAGLILPMQPRVAPCLSLNARFISVCSNAQPYIQFPSLPWFSCLGNSIIFNLFSYNTFLSQFLLSQLCITCFDFPLFVDFHILFLFTWEGIFRFEFIVLSHYFSFPSLPYDGPSVLQATFQIVSYNSLESTLSYLFLCAVF